MVEVKNLNYGDKIKFVLNHKGKKYDMQGEIVEFDKGIKSWNVKVRFSSCTLWINQKEILEVIE